MVFGGFVGSGLSNDLVWSSHEMVALDGTRDSIALCTQNLLLASCTVIRVCTTEWHACTGNPEDR